MSVKLWQLITLVVAALALTMESAHVLELPQKLKYDATMYTAVNGTLYRYFAIVGGAYQIGSIIAAGVLLYLVRGQQTPFRWTLAGFALLAAAFVGWLAVVQPVNSQAAVTLRDAPARLPEMWLQLRTRWEYGHALGFVLQLVGFTALAYSVIADSRPFAAD